MNFKTKNMVTRNFKTAEEIKNEISWYEKKLQALSDEKLTIKLVGEKDVLMTIGATVENESFHGVLAVEFVESLKKDLQGKIRSLENQRCKMVSLGYSTFDDGKMPQSLQYDLRRNSEPYLKGVFNNIINFFSLF